jgi:uncharacterized protein YyaL (SSP411 family)
VEGGFHVWGTDELEALLNLDEYREVSERFGLDGPPNFEHQSWHLVRNHKRPVNSIGETAMQKMRDARAKRTPPATDTKQLTSWNAMCIDGLARAGAALQREDWIDAAEAAMAFIKSTMWKNHSLLAVHAGGKTRLPAYLDDYAYLVRAGLSLLKARWDPQHLSFVIAVANAMIDRFADPENGGFYFSSADQDMPVARLRSLQDDATPSGNGIAAQALESLGHLVADQRYLDIAGRTLQSSYAEQRQHPLAHATLLVALTGHLKPAGQVIITGSDPQELAVWKAAINSHDRVNCYVLGSEPGEREGLPDFFEPGEKTRAYVCEGLRCLPPVTSLDHLQDQLNSLE